MSDHDPGNAGGSVTIPSPPKVTPRNWFTCDTCGERVTTREALDAHLLMHFGPRPALLIGRVEAPSTILIADPSTLDSVTVRNVKRVEISGAVVEPSQLRRVLERANGRHEFELVLVGRAEHVRRAYRLQIAILRPEKIAKIEADFLETLNRRAISAADLQAFTSRWSRLPERTYSDALAGFRLAMMMRDDRRIPVSSSESIDYRFHLAEARKSLAAVSTPLAKAIKAAGGFVVNDFTTTEGNLGDTRLANGLAYFRHLVDGSDLRWIGGRTGGNALVLDSSTELVLDGVDRIRAGSSDAAEALKRVLEIAEGQGDLMNAKKAAVALLSLGVSGGHTDLLVGDPVFVAALARTRHV